MDHKMSKSQPEGAILLHDPPEVIKRKIQGAFCPTSQIEGNPVLDLWRVVLIPAISRVSLPREERFGGSLEISSFEEFQALYREKKIHPSDLKGATALELQRLLAPVRKHFEEHPVATVERDHESQEHS